MVLFDGLPNTFRPVPRFGKGSPDRSVLTRVLMLLEQPEMCKFSREATYFG
jgi:hypothetical protein